MSLSCGATPGVVAVGFGSAGEAEGLAAAGEGLSWAEAPAFGVVCPGVFVDSALRSVLVGAGAGTIIGVGDAIAVWAWFGVTTGASIAVC
ncbi:MAG TPA: hypothetical protein PKA58_12825, partial [Polyangium sp.]|nr:hypothetical protein [Polyangium sp.]